MFIQKLIQSLTKYDVNYAVVGGYAVALHGAFRGTMDIDLVIQNDEQAFLHTCQVPYGYIPIRSYALFRAIDLLQPMIERHLSPKEDV